jgi:hypothetical protein
MNDILKLSMEYKVVPTQPEPFQITARIDIKDKDFAELIKDKYRNTDLCINHILPLIWIGLMRLDSGSIDLLSAIDEEVTIEFSHRKYAIGLLNKVEKIESKINKYFKQEIKTYLEAKEELKLLEARKYQEGRAI